MRLDLFLKASRLCPRRSVAQGLCEAGAVSLNGAPAKSSRAVHTGDTLALRKRDHLLTVRILSVPSTKQTSRTEAPTLYEIISDQKLDDKPAI
jgi:ribosomal 50S subunit-recycling heat shock protein